MKQDRWILFLKALWGAVIALLVISLLAGLIGGSDSWNSMLAGSIWIIMQLGILTMLLIIVVRIKEWIEGQVKSVADRKSDLQALQQSMERIETKVDQIEKVLTEVSE